MTPPNKLKTTSVAVLNCVDGQAEDSGVPLKNHHGGSGCIVVVEVSYKGKLEKIAAFGSYEKLKVWMDKEYPSDDYTALSYPLVVDMPEWSERVLN